MSIKRVTIVTLYAYFRKVFYSSFTSTLIYHYTMNLLISSICRPVLAFMLSNSTFSLVSF